MPAPVDGKTPLLLKAAILTAACLPIACATAPQDPQPVATAARNNANAITYETPSADLSRVIRDIGPVLPRGVVLMHGVHARKVGPYNWRNTSSEFVLDTLAQDGGFVRFDCGAYEFLAPPEYEYLSRAEVAARIPAGFSLPAADLAIGADTPLFDAFALMSQALNSTLIADNAVASARTGEISMARVNGRDAIDGLIKSARLDTATFNVYTGDNYLLFHAAGNPPRINIVGNRETLSEAGRNLLARRVDLILPWAEPQVSNVGAFASAASLESVLPSLSEQLGIRVTAQPELLRFPINPCLMMAVTIEDAIRLIINQWLVQDFVADFTPDHIHLRAVQPAVQRE